MQSQVSFSLANESLERTLADEKRRKVEDDGELLV